MELTYKEYYDKVYGCVLGKSVGGNVGGPAEGRKEIMDVPLDKEMLNLPMPNDDFDLQLLWLDVLNEKGINLTSFDLAKAFFECVPYGSGEYAAFKKNFGRGIYPPVSGKFNNEYYKNGMGCPIRSEVWACIFPGEKERTHEFVNMDGSLDHEYDSILGEIFMANIESDAFISSDIKSIIETNVELIPKDSRIYGVLRDTLDWCKSGYDWKYIRSLIIKKYGHPDCTNLYQNMGLIVMILMLADTDLYEVLRLGVACGFDTDCVCASAASVVGIVLGAERMMSEFGVKDTGIIAGVKLKKEYFSVADIAKEITEIGVNFCNCEGKIKIVDAPDVHTVPTERILPPITFEIDYLGKPVITYGGKKDVEIHITNNTDKDIESNLVITAPNGLVAETENKVSVPARERVSVKVKVSCPEEIKLLCHKNIFTFELEESNIEYNFGIIGADVWKMYGPFYENNRDITNHSPYKPYWDLLKGEDDKNDEDVLRDYHLNIFADINKEYLPELGFFANPDNIDIPQKIGETIQLTEDLFDLANLQSYQGPNVTYLYRKLYSPEDREVDIAIGATAPFKLWLNGELLGGSNECSWWTAENRHFHKVKFKKGENEIVWKLSQVSDSAKFSIWYRMPDTMWSQYYDFASICE